MSRILTRSFAALLLLIGSAGAGAVGFDEARHLLVRTGFEATPAAMERLRPLRYEHAVALLLKETRTEAVTPPPAWSGETPLWPAGRLDAAGRAQRARERRARELELKGWWFRELRATPSPLTERMTLLWHGYFTCGLDQVPAPQLAWRQNALLRREALGSLRVLLKELSRDPAMMACRGIDGSRKEKPDETFARMLLQLTVGRGRYTAHDVSEAARAFTGWRISPQTGAAEFDPARHDGGLKAVLASRGRLDGEKVIEAVLRDPQTAEQVVRRLWREFIDDRPDPVEVQRLAREFRKDYQIKPLVRGLLLTRAFRAPARRGQMIKSPVELLAGTARQFSIPVGDGREFARASRGLGQDLFDPPAEGWRGGAAWISAETLAARTQLLARLMRAQEQDEQGAVFAPGLEDLTPSQTVAVVLAVPPVDPIPAALSSFDLAGHLVRDPAYQLK